MLKLYFEAAMYNRGIMAQDLINGGADLNSQTNDGETALMLGKLYLVCNFDDYSFNLISSY